MKIIRCFLSKEEVVIALAKFAYEKVTDNKLIMLSKVNVMIIPDNEQNTARVEMEIKE